MSIDTKHTETITAPERPAGRAVANQEIKRQVVYPADPLVRQMSFRFHPQHGLAWHWFNLDPRIRLFIAVWLLMVLTLLCGASAELVLRR